MQGTDPKWLQFLSRRMAWLAVPNIAIILVTLQVLGFLMILSNPAWMSTLALFPDRAIHGEPWRFLTFLSLPVSNNIIWFAFKHRKAGDVLRLENQTRQQQGTGYGVSLSPLRDRLIHIFTHILTRTVQALNAINS